MPTRRDLKWAAMLLILAVLSMLIPRCSKGALPTDYRGYVRLIPTGATGTHTDFPAMVRLARGQLWYANEDLSDVRVFGAGGNMLDTVIGAAGADSVDLFFRAPTLTSTSEFYVYHGNTDSTTFAVGDSVWVDYAAVYDYAQNPASGTLTDQSGNGNDAYATGPWISAYRGSGISGSGWFNDNGRGVDAPGMNVTGDWTVSAWCRPIGNSTDVLMQGNPWWWFIAVQASNANPQPSAVFRYGDWNISYAFSGCANDGSWAKYDFIYTTDPDTALTVYRNGEVCTVSGIYEIGGANFGGADISTWYELGYDVDLLGTDWNQGSAPLGIASQSYATGGNQQDQFNGYVDMVWVKEAAISATWAADSYTNQKNPQGWWDLLEVYQTDPALAYTAPVINNISGYRNTNGDRLTITGTSFGSRPVQKEDFWGTWLESATIGDGLPEIRSAYADTSSAGITGRFYPRVAGEYVWSGSKAMNLSTDMGVDAGLYERPFVFHDSEKFNKVYFSYWVYLDPTTVTNDGEDTQHKSWRLAGPLQLNNSFLSNQTGNFEGIYRYTPDGPTTTQLLSYCGLDCSGGPSLQTCTNYKTVLAGPDFVTGRGTNELNYPMELSYPFGTWTKVTVEIDAGTLAGSWVDTEFRLYQRYAGKEETGPASWIKTIQTFTSKDASDGCRSYPATYFEWAGYVGYVDDFDSDGAANDACRIYMDDWSVQTGTWARVELGNRSTYDACTILEYQPVATWSDTAINIDYNHGRFAVTDPVYLFVVADDGRVSRGKLVPPPPNSKPGFNEGGR